MSKGIKRATLAIAPAAIAFLLAAVPALAVDRALGADVPKPAVTGTPWIAAEIAALDANVDIALAGAATIRGAHAGIYAIDARDGRVLYQRNADDAFQPASTLKLVIGSAALEKLGRDFRFVTEAIVPDGVELRGGELLGPIKLRGSGDVLLDDKALEELAPALHAAGIDALHGVGYVDDRTQPPYLPGWSWDDFPWYYAAPVTALGLNDNQVTLTVAPGARPGDRVDVTVAPWGTVCYAGSRAGCATDLGFEIEVRATTGAPRSGSSLDVVRADAWSSDRVTLVGALAADAKPEYLSIAVPSPPRYAAAAARRALVRAHYRLLPELSATNIASTGRAIWQHRSEPLADMLADLWWPSDNILAEELLRALGAAAPNLQGSSEAGIAGEKTWLKTLGIDPEAIAISDASGLSVYDRIRPRDLVVILKHDWDGPNRDLVLDDLPIAGARGTLKTSYLGTAAEKHVFAKTGSLSHVSAVAGYAANTKHGAIIFTFLVDDWVGDPAALSDLQGRVLSLLVES